MARLLVLILCALSVLTVLGCTEEDAPPLYLETDFTLRCGGCEPRVPDGPRHDIATIDDDQGASLSCYAEDIGGKRRLTLNLNVDMEGSSDDFQFTIDQINVEGEDPGEGCQIRVGEGANTFEGNCKSPDDDSSDAPCEIELTEVGSTTRGTLYCSDFRDPETGYTRDLVKPGTTDTAAAFEILGCEGL